MRTVLRQCFSIVSKIKTRQRKTHGTNFPTAPTHIFQDKIVTSVRYQSQVPSLSPHQMFLLDNSAMQRAFTGYFWSEISPGFYHCGVCDTRLFTFNQKYESNTGYATFWMAVENRVKIVEGSLTFEHQVNPARPEFKPVNLDHKKCQCSQCGVTLGALFYDGPPPTFLRYTINSAFLKFYEMNDFPNPHKEKLMKRKLKFKPKVKMLK